jgi:hypothetical protein
MLTNPDNDLGKTEFLSIHRSANELIPGLAFDVHIEAIPPQEDISSTECDSLITVNEAVVIDERFHQGGRFFF